jgi:hypothetical protein
MRDDFADAIKRTIGQRVNNRCSNPTCGAQTAGPQIDPTKALNIGVAAHITAASPGGARYDRVLTDDERSHPSNAIWLCQSCAKLIDNDPLRYTVDLLRQWKREAEEAAFSVIGRTTTDHSSRYLSDLARLQKWVKISIRPAVPRRFESETYVIETSEGNFIDVKRIGFDQQLRVPMSAVLKVHDVGELKPLMVLLDGRLQWSTLTRRWQFLPEKPPTGATGEYGVSKAVGLEYPQHAGLTTGFTLRWFHEESVPGALLQGWHVFYDADGDYLRNRGPDVDQILLSQMP